MEVRVTPEKYQEVALRTQACQLTILARINQYGPPLVQLDMASRGLADEVGEINGAVKRFIEYGKPLDTTNILEEAGDILWRLWQTLDAAAQLDPVNASLLTFASAFRSNIEKLAVRYPTEFNDYLANNRNLEAERMALESCPDPEIGRRFLDCTVVEDAD
jgi:NTP pyrophosphatase (non-canonical NTP hydrolase)